MKVLFNLCIFIASVYSITCPYLDLEAKVDSGVCYSHPGVVPTDIIKAGSDCFDNSKKATVTS